MPADEPALKCCVKGNTATRMTFSLSELASKFGSPRVLPIVMIAMLQTSVCSHCTYCAISAKGQGFQTTLGSLRAKA